MSSILRRDPETLVPDVIEWFEEPFVAVRPYPGRAIRVEDYTQGGRCVIRAEIAGIDPQEELGAWAGAGYLTIRAARPGKPGDKHRTGLRYGSFRRAVQLPPGAGTDDVTTGYSHGILTIKVGLKGQQQAAVREVQAGSSEK